MRDCKPCEGDGYQEKLDDDMNLITWICPECGGTGKVKEEL